MFLSKNEVKRCLGSSSIGSGAQLSSWQIVFDTRADAAARFLKQPRLGPIAWLFQKYADGSFICLPHGLDSTLEQVGAACFPVM